MTGPWEHQLSGSEKLRTEKPARRQRWNCQTQVRSWEASVMGRSVSTNALNLLFTKTQGENGSLQTEMAGHLLARKDPSSARATESHTERGWPVAVQKKQPVTIPRKIMRWPTWPNGKGHMDAGILALLWPWLYLKCCLKVRLPCGTFILHSSMWETRLLSKNEELEHHRSSTCQREQAWSQYQPAQLFKYLTLVSYSFIYLLLDSQYSLCTEYYASNSEPRLTSSPW